MKKELIRIEEEVTSDLPEERTDSTDAAKKLTGKHRLAVSLAADLVLIPAVILLGGKLIAGKSYQTVSLLVAVLACLPFFMGFEKGKTRARELVVLAVMTAISVAGRLIFQPLPGFKPVTAIVIITAIAFGMQAGFITGAMTAVVSNIYFGQGPWTPFQMFAWGFLGLLTGLIFRRSRKPNPIVLSLMGIVGGVLFSFIMDVWSVLSIDGTWNLSRYLALLASGAEVTVIYAVSNVIFLLILTKPFLEKLNRIKDKYGLFGS